MAVIVFSLLGCGAMAGIVPSGRWFVGTPIGYFLSTLLAT